MVIDINKGNIQEILQREETILLDFWAVWCGPCRMIKPHLESVAKELGDKVVLAKVNVDENSDIAQQYGVQGIPCVVVIKNGLEVGRISSGVSPQKLRDTIMRLINEV